MNVSVVDQRRAFLVVLGAADGGEYLDVVEEVAADPVAAGAVLGVLGGMIVRLAGVELPVLLRTWDGQLSSEGDAMSEVPS